MPPASSPASPSAASWPVIGGSSLLQGTLPGTEGRLRAVLRRPRLDAVVRTVVGDGHVLHHYRRDQHRPDENWQRGPVIAATSSGPAALAQRPGRRLRRGDLEALVPEPDGLVHYWRDPNRELDGPWRRAGIVAARADAAGLVARAGGLDALVLSEGRVDHYRWDALPDRRGWTRCRTVAEGVRSAPALAVAPDGILEAVTLHDDRATTRRLSEEGWVAGPAVPASGAPSLARRGDLTLLAVPVGTTVELYRRTSAASRWEAAEVFDCGLEPVLAVSLVASALDGWFQALTQEGTSLFQWHRQEHAGGVRWRKAACLRLDDRGPHAVDARSSVKVAQISGEVDTQPAADGRPRITLSSSASRSRVRGTDLGVRIHHAGGDYLLCGDTHWTDPLLATRDSIARITPPGPVPGAPGFEFHGAPLKLIGGRVTMREYDVPLDAFSHRGQLFLLATSNHFLGHQVMGRSVLARAIDDPARISGDARRPLRFRTLTTVSSHRFVNISCATLPGAIVDGLGLDHDVVALWGSGGYRADDLRLAVLDPEALTDRLLGDRPFRPQDLQLRFFAGLRHGRPTWTPRESQARPLLSPGAFGELSVRWVPEIGRYVLLAMSGPEDPIGPCVTLRTSRTPWGPWSPRVALVDWIRSGMSLDDPSSRFIRATLEASEPVGDRIFRSQRDATGGAYAPYLFDTRLDGDDLVLRYTLSTWNPYQIVLMQHRLSLAELGG